MKEDLKIVLDSISMIKKYGNLTPDAIDDLLYIEGFVNERECRINKAIEYIENDMPYLEEPDDDYENNHKMKEYDKTNLLDILKGSEQE